MENFNYDNQNIFDTFCADDNILKFFNSFYILLQDSKSDRKICDFSGFLKCLQYLDQNNIFVSDRENIKKVKSILLKIFDILGSKYFSNNILNENFEKNFEIELFNINALLIKILVPNCCQNLSLEPLCHYLIDYFTRYSSVVGYYIEDDELNKDNLQHVFKFFFDVLRSLDCNSFSYFISNDILIQLLNSFPFCNKYTTNVFINHIIPNIFEISDSSRIKTVLEFIWNKINNFHKLESYHFSLLCCFFEFMFKNQHELEDFSIFEDKLWKIIQNGLKSENSFNRKQVLYVFKIILFWLKSKQNTTIVHSKGTLFTFYQFADLIIWNDLVTLFEALEEKQVSIILLS